MTNEQRRSRWSILSKILGHSNVMITQKVYAHLAPDAWEQDFHRVSFVVPESGVVYALTKRKPNKVTHASNVPQAKCA